MDCVVLLVGAICTAAESTAQPVPNDDTTPTVGCLSGTIVIGEGTHAGTIEFLGCPADGLPYEPPLSCGASHNTSTASPSVVVRRNEDGTYSLPRCALAPGLAAAITVPDGDMARPIARIAQRGRVIATTELVHVLLPKQHQRPCVDGVHPGMWMVRWRDRGATVGEGYAWSIVPQSEQYGAACGEEKTDAIAP